MVATGQNNVSGNESAPGGRSQPTLKQRARVDEFPDTAKVIDYDVTLRGPVIKLENGARVVVTRDGGVTALKPGA
jgi:hypothetical protein